MVLYCHYARFNLVPAGAFRRWSDGSFRHKRAAFGLPIERKAQSECTKVNTSNDFLHGVGKTNFPQPRSPHPSHACVDCGCTLLLFSENSAVVRSGGSLPCVVGPGIERERFFRSSFIIICGRRFTRNKKSLLLVHVI